ncbi:MAG TPA: VOC family protein [Amycolatopsis sp.]|nr:VOC family protein [Amycolatopsis sp.]
MSDSVLVRYIVDDVDAAIGFYTAHLGFTVVMRPAPTFAMIERGALRLALSAPGGQGGGGQTLTGGQVPAPGGWNRISLTVTDLEAEVQRLRAAGVHFRSEVVIGVGGDQVLIEDPAGNPVELFRPKTQP